MNNINNHIKATKKHLNDLKHQYINNDKNITKQPLIYIINLIDKKDKQGELGQWLVEVLTIINNTDHILQKNDHISNKNDHTNENEIMDMKERVRSVRLDRSVTSCNDYWNQGIISRLIWFDYHYKVKHKKVESIKELVLL